MKYVLVFMHNTAGYRAHAEGCSAAQDRPATSRNAASLFPERFDTVKAAHDFADVDEREKGGTRANFKVCKCAKTTQD